MLKNICVLNDLLSNLISDSISPRQGGGGGGMVYSLSVRKLRQLQYFFSRRRAESMWDFDEIIGARDTVVLKGHWYDISYPVFFY